jgi:hypothetical protein
MQMGWAHLRPWAGRSVRDAALSHALARATARASDGFASSMESPKSPMLVFSIPSSLRIVVLHLRFIRIMISVLVKHMILFALTLSLGVWGWAEHHLQRRGVGRPPPPHTVRCSILRVLRSARPRRGRAGPPAAGGGARPLLKLPNCSQLAD